MSRGIIAAALVAYMSIGVDAQCQQIAGYYYCSQTNVIQYGNVGFSGSYNKITSMDSTSCQCSSTPASFGGGLAPLNDEV